MPKTDFSQPNQRDVELDRDVLRSLRRIIQAVDLYSRRLASQHGLTGPQIVCLREVQRNGPMNPGYLARRVSLSPPTVSGILDRLEARGLLTRERRSQDKRQVLVKLTRQGRALLSHTPPSLQELFTRRFNELPEKRRSAIAKVLQQVVELMEAEDIDAAPLLARGAANPALLEMPYKRRKRGGQREAS